MSRLPAATAWRVVPRSSTPTSSGSGARSVSRPRTSSMVPRRAVGSTGETVARAGPAGPAIHREMGMVTPYSATSRGACETSCWKPAARSTDRVSGISHDVPSLNTSRARAPGVARKRTVTGSPSAIVIAPVGPMLPATMASVPPVRASAVAVSWYTPFAGTGR